MHELSKYIDHTILKPDTTNQNIEQLCSEAMTNKFVAVCVPPYYVKMAFDILEKQEIKIATVVGFPMGYSTIASKVEEAKRAIEDGADELDVVVNISAVKNKRWNYVENELDIMTTTCHLQNKKIKIIFETGLLDNDEIIKLCQIAKTVGADFVKTSTGMNGSGATVEIVRLMKENLPSNIKIEASGGIKNLETAQAMINAGADRIGTSSSVIIVNQKLV